MEKEDDVMFRAESLAGFPVTPTISLNIKLVSGRCVWLRLSRWFRESRTCGEDGLAAEPQHPMAAFRDASLPLLMMSAVSSSQGTG